MQSQGKGQGELRSDRQILDVDVNAAGVHEVRLERSLHERGEAGALPVGRDERGLGGVERPDAPAERFEELLDRSRSVSGALGQDADHGQQILHAMRELRRQDLLAFLRLLAIVDIGGASRTRR